MPPAQIFIDAVGDTGGKLLLLIVIGAQLFCGMASVTANSRMIYAFSRDGALPGSRFWHRINPRTRTPTNAIWLAAGGAFVLGLPYLWNATAYAAVTSIAVIGLYIAYVLPTFLRLRQGDELRARAVAPGPVEPPDRHRSRWSGSSSSPCCSCCRTVSPVSAANFNYTPIAVLVVLGFAGIWWLVSARNWFTGPEGAGHAGGAGRGRAGAGEPCLTGRRPSSTVEDLRQPGRRTARSTPSLVAITDMQGRLQGKRLHAPVLPGRGRSSTAPRAATTCSPSTST